MQVEKLAPLFGAYDVAVWEASWNRRSREESSWDVCESRVVGPALIIVITTMKPASDLHVEFDIWCDRIFEDVDEDLLAKLSWKILERWCRGHDADLRRHRSSWLRGSSDVRELEDRSLRRLLAAEFSGRLPEPSRDPKFDVIYRRIWWHSLVKRSPAGGCYSEHIPT